MPFVSRAQRRKFYSDPKLRKYISEWESDTPAHIPERLRVPKRHSEPTKGKVPERRTK